MPSVASFHSGSTAVPSAVPLVVFQPRESLGCVLRPPSAFPAASSPASYTAVPPYIHQNPGQTQTLQQQLAVEGGLGGVEDQTAQRSATEVGGTHHSKAVASEWNRMDWSRDPFYGWRSQSAFASVSGGNGGCAARLPLSGTAAASAKLRSEASPLTPALPVQPPKERERIISASYTAAPADPSTSDESPQRAPKAHSALAYAAESPVRAPAQLTSSSSRFGWLAQPSEIADAPPSNSAPASGARPVPDDSHAASEQLATRSLVSPSELGARKRVRKKKWCGAC